MDRTPTEAEFLGHVAKHEVTIVLDAGMHRHLTLKQPGSFNRHFHIVTWPGYLAFSGDMGSFVFARLPDMFEFFRKEGPSGGITPGYWSEKLTAIDRGGYHEFSPAFYHDAIKSDFAGWEFESDEARATAWGHIEDAGLTSDPENIDHAITLATDYRCPVSDQRFTDFWDHNLRDYTYYFIWCCRAVQWAIEQYDAVKAPTAEVAA